MFVRPRAAPVIAGRNVEVQMSGEAAHLAALLVMEGKGEIDLVSPLCPHRRRRER